MLGVYLFVAFPIPLTGVWTGSAIATFIDLPFWKAMLMVWLGNVTAGAIVTLLAFFLSAYMNIILDIFFIIVILVLVLFIVKTVVKMVKNKKQAQSEQTEQDTAMQASIDGNTANEAPKAEELQDATAQEQPLEDADKVCTAHTSTNTKKDNDEEK